MKSAYRHLFIPLILVGTILVLGLTVYTMEHPENKLIGTWKEVSWTYEKADGAVDMDTSIVKQDLDDEIKNNIAQNLVIHQSETWTFKSNSELVLIKKSEKPQNLRWRLKGRGHVLKLAYNEELKEYYQLKELTDDRMVLHFENDMHTRGIVKIVFEKIKESHAKKI